MAILPSRKVKVGAEGIYRQHINLWRSGTKLCVISDDARILDDLRIRVDNFIRELDEGSYEHFTVYDKQGRAKSNTFNLEFCSVED